MEWEVREDDPKFFSTDRQPQLPYERCRTPSVSSVQRRRLGKERSPEFQEKAEVACARAGDEFDACMHDVMKTGDMSFAGAG